MSKKHSSERGRYRVEVSPAGKATLHVRAADSAFFVPFQQIVEDATDLDDLFTVIGSVLAEIQNEQ
jgi:hypothetical protein